MNLCRRQPVETRVRRLGSALRSALWRATRRLGLVPTLVRHEGIELLANLGQSSRGLGQPPRVEMLNLLGQNLLSQNPSGQKLRKCHDAGPPVASPDRNPWTIEHLQRRRTWPMPWPLFFGRRCNLFALGRSAGAPWHFVSHPASFVSALLWENLIVIKDYHAHVYFDASSRDRAGQLCEASGRALPLVVGRMHDRPVGPHPRGSCQLTFAPEQFAQVIAWLMLNRNGLTVFAHANTGDSLKDHTDHVLWLGPSETLNLSALGR